MDAIFKQYPELAEYYQTEDEQCFFSENDAKNHAKTLDNKLVKPVKNPKLIDAVAEEIVVEDTTDAEKLAKAEAAAKAIEAKAKADAEAKAIEEQAKADAEAKEDKNSKPKK